MSLSIEHRVLHFLRAAKTSRNTLFSRDAYYFILRDKESCNVGIGECAPIFGLSPETKEFLQAVFNLLKDFSTVNEIPEEILYGYPSVRFALETAIRDFQNGGQRIVYPNHPTDEIPINGLVWMNGKETMLQEAIEKIEEGFSCIKLKIGGIQFEDEIDIIRELKLLYPKIEIRLDANGSFSPKEALVKIERLSKFEIHSIEQPIRAGQWKEMASITQSSPIPIALDEELIPIGVNKSELLDKTKPHYVILKPTLHGGFKGCDEWIEQAELRNIKWWATSALESNIGLNAIAQWVSTYHNSLPQGLGTGKLYVDNISSPLQSGNGYFWWDNSIPWRVESLIR